MLQRMVLRKLGLGKKVSVALTTVPHGKFPKCTCNTFLIGVERGSGKGQDCEWLPSSKFITKLV